MNNSTAATFTSQVSANFNIIGVQGLISLRMYALCQGYRPVTIALAVTCITGLALAIYVRIGLIRDTAIILLDVFSFIVVVCQASPLWKLKQCLQLQYIKERSGSLVATLLHQGEKVLSIIVCEFTLDLRRRNAKKLSLNQSALTLPTLSVQSNPTQSIQSVLGRLHESIVAEMGERNELVPNINHTDGPGSDELQMQTDMSLVSRKWNFMGINIHPREIDTYTHDTSRVSRIIRELGREDKSTLVEVFARSSIAWYYLFFDEGTLGIKMGSLESWAAKDADYILIHIFTDFKIAQLHTKDNERFMASLSITFVIVMGRLILGSHELELNDSVLVKRIRVSNDPIYTTMVSDFLPKIIRDMTNLSRVKLSWKNTDFEVSRNLLGALGDSGCRLEEFDLFFDIPRFKLSEDPTIFTAMMKVEELQLWTKLDRIALQKLSIWIGTRWDRTSFPLGQANWAKNMLSDIPKLTHLSLTIQHTSFIVKVLDYTWPNLENLVINNNNSYPIYTIQPPSILTDFLTRHPKLITLSLPCNIYPPSTSPYITLERLPKLESFSYDAAPQAPLSQILSPASARQLRHLTIDDSVVLFEPQNNLDIFKELTSLQTCCFTLEARASNYNNIDQVLDVLAIHATGLQKIHLPTAGGLLKKYYATLSILRRFPRLTHLSGVWAYNIDSYDILLEELFQCRQLEYAIHVGHDNTPRAFRLIREFEPEDKDKRMLVEAVSGKNPDFDMRTWGNFYNKV
ncbi:hypothetical protein Clacol_007165 [Clathrus columnatus]|uniref:F-box domain-containing protein n=1 Tax=Clathrus columnatus TaxID=1419009 RepID=A0AAV5AHE9_9AGAM|nr:hypothetical protein Clacol_007165 [Clathrus columnatus]